MPSKNQPDPLRKPIKMIDLARLAGVSKSTVSRALADSPLIPASTKKRIVDLAQKHNYRLNKRARNFRTKETLTIAVLIPDTQEKDWRMSDPFFLQFLGNIADALNDMSHELLLAKTDASTESWVQDHVTRGTCDGLILVGQGTQHEEINKLADGNVPFVVWGGRLDDQRYCTVGSDNRLGGQKATAHLIDEGCRKIIFLGDRRLPEVALRFQGYRDALAGANLDLDETLLINTSFSGETTYASVTKFLAEGIVPDGVVASSDVIAMAAIRALTEKGLKVPENVAVVGYDDIALSSYYSPPISTIRQDCKTGGQELVKRLLRIINGEKADSLILETDLIIRQSSRRTPADDRIVYN